MTNTFTRELRFMYVSILAAIIPFGLLLYFLPNETAAYWPWIIPNPRSAILIGGGYIAAVFYFVLALRGNDWTQVEAGQGALFTFVVVLDLATMADWDQFRPYAITTLIWLAIYYGAPFMVPLAYRLQEHRRVAPKPSPEIAPGWAAWLRVRGLLYLALVVLGFLFADAITALWPWPMRAFEFRVFLAQVALTGWSAVILLQYGRLWRQHRYTVLITALLGILQLIGLALNGTAYNLSAPLGIVLPILFIEWIATSVLLLYKYRNA